MNRRGFLKRAGLAAAGTIATGFVAAANGNTPNNDPEGAKSDAYIPAVRKGTTVNAEDHSFYKKIMTIQIGGPNEDELKEAAQELVDEYKNLKKPKDVVVFYNPDPHLNEIMGSIYMNGETFKLPSGDEHFELETLKKFTAGYAAFYDQRYPDNLATAMTNE